MIGWDWTSELIRYARIERSVIRVAQSTDPHIRSDLPLNFNPMADM
jgi:hypothetical protein